MIRLSRSYDLDSESFILDDYPVCLEQFRGLNRNGLFQYLFDILRHLKRLELTDDELAMFSAATLFGPGTLPMVKLADMDFFKGNRKFRGIAKNWVLRLGNDVGRPSLGVLCQESNLRPRLNQRIDRGLRHAVTCFFATLFFRNTFFFSQHFFFDGHPGGMNRNYYNFVVKNVLRTNSFVLNASAYNVIPKKRCC